MDYLRFEFTVSVYLYISELYIFGWYYCQFRGLNQERGVIFRFYFNILFLIFENISCKVVGCELSGDGLDIFSIFVSMWFFE